MAKALAACSGEKHPHACGAEHGSDEQRAPDCNGDLEGAAQRIGTLTAQLAGLELTLSTLKAASQETSSSTYRKLSKPGHATTHQTRHQSPRLAQSIPTCSNSTTRGGSFPPGTFQRLRPGQLPVVAGRLSLGAQPPPPLTQISFEEGPQLLPGGGNTNQGRQQLERAADLAGFWQQGGFGPQQRVMEAALLSEQSVEGFLKVGCVVWNSFVRQ